MDTLSNDLATSAKRLGTSRATLWKLIGKREIKSFSIGKKRYISEEELQRFIRAQEQAAHESVAAAK